MVKDYCPYCTEELKKKEDKLDVKAKNQTLKHPEDYIDFSFDVFQCPRCYKCWAIKEVKSWLDL